MSYAAYLTSQHWQTVRAEAIDRAGHRCMICYAKHRPLEVHHRTYERLGSELPTDVICLCDECHGRHSEAMMPRPQYFSDGTDHERLTKWYPKDRAGEIILALETTTDPDIIRSLLSEKIAIDKARHG